MGPEGDTVFRVATRTSARAQDVPVADQLLQWTNSFLDRARGVETPSLNRASEPRTESLDQVFSAGHSFSLEDVHAILKTALDSKMQELSQLRLPGSTTNPECIW
jgi:hypothetical protein